MYYNSSNGGEIYRQSCLDGFFLAGATIADVGETFTFVGNIISNSSSLQVADIEFEMSECPAGYGADRDSSSSICTECELNSFTLDSSISSCVECSSVVKDYSSQEALQCLRTDYIDVTWGFWLYIERQSTNNTDNDELDYTVIYSDCPAGFCCRNTAGCDYLRGIENYNDPNNRLCAKNRDPTVALCGECLDDFYELYGTSQFGYVFLYN